MTALWWAVAYLGFGCATWLPLALLSYRQIYRPGSTFWEWLGIRKWRHIPLQVALWPLVVWEVLR